jgi:hypothetical protein
VWSHILRTASLTVITFYIGGPRSPAARLFAVFIRQHQKLVSFANWKSRSNNRVNVPELLHYAYIYQLVSFSRRCPSFSTWHLSLFSFSFFCLNRRRQPAQQFILFLFPRTLHHPTRQSKSYITGYFLLLFLFYSCGSHLKHRASVKRFVRLDI